MTSPDSSERLGFREKLFYGFGDLGSCIFWCSFMNNLAFFYTDIFGITPAAVSLIFFVSKFWDAANDPMVGMLADRTKTRWGRYRPFLMWFSLPLCIAAVLMFTTPDFGMTGKLVWAWVTYNLVMTLYTLVNIPYTALLGTISPDANERSRVSTFKFACAFGAGVLVSYTFLPMTRDFGGGDPARGWQMAALVVSAIALPFFLICFAGTRERVTPVVSPLGVRARSTVRQDLKDLAVNRPWLILVGITMAFVFYTAVRSTVMNYYLKYFVVGEAGTVVVNLPFLGSRTWDFETLQSTFNTTGQFASVLGVLVIGLFVTRVEKKKNFLGWYAIGVVFTALPFWLGPGQTELVLLANIIQSMASAPLCVLIWAMYADAAEYSEWKNDRQAAGLVFSASTFAQQLGWGFGPAATMWVLGRVGYAPNVAQTSRVSEWLVLLVSLVPAAFGVLSMAFMMIYPLTNKRVHEMSDELKARRMSALPQSQAAIGN